MIVLRNKKTPYYIISEKPDLHKQTLYPAVPNNFLVRGGYLDSKLPRIQVFKSVSDALSATYLGQKLRPGSKMYVYEVLDLNPESLIGPLGIDKIPYFRFIKEWWYLRGCSLKLVAPIVIEELKKEEAYHYGPRQTKAPIYRWSWSEVYEKPWEKKFGPKLPKEKQYSDTDIDSLNDRQLEKLANKVVSHRKKVRLEKNKLKTAKNNTLATTDSKPSLTPTVQDEATVRATKALKYKKALKTEENVIRKELINTIRNDNN